jgi:hypothetical protein
MASSTSNWRLLSPSQKRVTFIKNKIVFNKWRPIFLQVICYYTSKGTIIAACSQKKNYSGVNRWSRQATRPQSLPNTSGRDSNFFSFFFQWLYNVRIEFWVRYLYGTRQILDLFSFSQNAKCQLLWKNKIQNIKIFRIIFSFI